MVEKKKQAVPVLLTAPVVVLIVVILLIPMGYAVYCSLWRCDYMIFSKFLGLQNYIDLLSKPEILKDIGRSFYTSILSALLALGFGVLLAVWVNKCNRRTALILELIILVPWVTSMVIAAMLWRWMLNDNVGILKYLCQKLFGITQTGFLTNSSTAIYTLILVMTWRVVGYVMVQALAGLKAIPEDLIEAARIDGANKWDIFWRVRLPLIKTPLTISFVIVFLSNINNLTVPWTLTGGGPGSSTTTIAVELYKYGFTHYYFGDAAALSMLLILINTILTVIYLKAVKYEI